jgi:hypothetical protein
MLNNNLIQIFIKKYTQHNYSVLKLAKEYKITKYKVTKILKQNNIKIRDRYYYTRKYKINANAFDIIDNIDKAYMLGFICADGCIYDNKCLVIGIHKKDICVLELLKKILECETLPIKKHSQNKNIVMIYVWNKQLITSFKKLGVTERKTFTISLPKNIPENLNEHFWRGVIDGDGCLYLKQNNNHNKPTFTVTIVGSNQLLKDYIDFLKTLNINPLPKIKLHKNIWYVTICSKNAIMFCKKIYNDDKLFCLQRKKEKFLKAYEIIKKQRKELPKGMIYTGKKRKIKVAALKSAGFDKEYHIGIFDTLEEALTQTHIFYKSYNKKYILDYGDWS